jgi:hypothetical protein
VNNQLYAQHSSTQHSSQLGLGELNREGLHKTWKLMLFGGNRGFPLLRMLCQELAFTSMHLQAVTH